VGYNTYQIILLVLAIGISFWAQSQVQNKYAHFSKVPTENGINGYQVARKILDSKGLQNVDIQVSQRGLLSDHYDPKTNTVNLSPKVYNDSTVASVAVAAHEVGHAIQYAENYSFVGIRNMLLPATIVSSYLGWVAIMIGLLSYSLDFLFWIGLMMIGVLALFQLVTLPLEFNASSRALKILEEDNYISIDEVADSKSMLNAAAMTYLAAFLASLLTIMRLLLIRGSRRR
jgi:Zn-dependent membrane protease YugP